MARVLTVGVTAGGREPHRVSHRGWTGLDSGSSGLLGLHVEDSQVGEAGGYTVTGERQSGPDLNGSSRVRKLDLRLTDDLMVMEPEDRLQVKVKTCPRGHSGPEPSIWVRSGGRPGMRTLKEARLGAGEEHLDFRSIKVRVPEDI